MSSETNPEFLPRTASQEAEQSKARQAWGLALSGGGFRATAFHIGVIAFLRDAGILSMMQHMTSVSGGSILAAHMLLHWKDYISDDDDVFTSRINSIINFLHSDVRGRVVRRYATKATLSFLLRRLTFGKIHLQSSTAAFLENEYKSLYSSALNGEIKDAPSFDILASNLTLGGSCSFTRNEYAIHHRFAGQTRAESIRAEAIPISLAVAASSAFPGFVSPILIDDQLIQGDNFEPSEQLLTDGGVFDNLGSRRYEQLVQDGIVDFVFVSDAGRPFRKSRTVNTSNKFIAPALRATDMMGERVNLFEKEAISRDRRYVIASLTDIIERECNDKDDNYFDQHASSYEMQMALQCVRTDLDKFEDRLLSRLIVQGYCSAKRAYCKANVCPLPSKAYIPFDIVTDQGGLKIKREPSKDLKSDFKLVKNAAIRKIHFISLRDPITWLHIAAVSIGICFAICAISFAWPYGQDLIQAVRSYYVVHGTSLPNVWKLEEDPRAVTKVAQPSYNGFEVKRDVRVWDLRRWKRVDDLLTTNLESPVFLTRTITLRRREGYENSHILVNIKSKGSFVEARCTGFNCKYLRQEEPTEYLGSNSAEDRRMADLPTHLWQLDIDVSHKDVNKWFELPVEVIFWNSFQNDHGEYVAAQVDANQAEMGIWIILPESKAFKRNSFQRLAGPQLANLGITTGGNLYPSNDNRSVYWQVLNPTPLYYYELKWNW
jgi:predicted acylesterase/phospholipase RssA